MKHDLKAKDALKNNQIFGLNSRSFYNSRKQMRAFSTISNQNSGKTCTICHFPHVVIGGDPCQYLPIFEKHMNITAKNVPSFF